VSVFLREANDVALYIWCLVLGVAKMTSSKPA